MTEIKESTVLDPVVEEARLLSAIGDGLRCEVINNCLIHGEEECGNRARWIARWTCEHGTAKHILVCDSCHEDMVANPGHYLMEDVRELNLEWSPL